MNEWRWSSSENRFINLMPSLSTSGPILFQGIADILDGFIWLLFSLLDYRPKGRLYI
ncbi:MULTISPECIES: hypothetical protein [unclassified Sporosarcina]|uniref:hypothetical protein n=1 Tax=unclassified Sporosarcina TaxID=2647733 RepID=UPI0013045946|nr:MULTISPECIES: hypothetical protein [unclassified Sporosarcina]